MSASKDELKFYLTGAEPLVTQTTLSQSIGGYPTTSEINPSLLLGVSISRPGRYNPSSSSSSSPTGAGADTQFRVSGEVTSPFIQIGDEIMEVVSYDNQIVTVVRASLSTTARFHVAGDTVWTLENNNLFNSSFSADLKQYRCIAIKNVGINTFFNLKFYFKYGSTNATSGIRMALEIPQTEILTGTSTAGSSISLVDSSLRNLFNTEHDGSVLMITSGDNVGLGRKIASFDKATGTFTFLTALPYAVAAGTTYRVENAPSQRIVSGTSEPTSGTIYTSDFAAPTNLAAALSLDFSETRLNGVDLLPNEVVYLWLEREISQNVDSFDNNRVVLAASYGLT